MDAVQRDRAWTKIASSPEGPDYDGSLMRGYGLAAIALGAFFLALALWLSELAWPHLDRAIAALLVGGIGAALYAYVKVPLIRVRRLAVIAWGLNGAALVLLVVSR